MLKCCGCQTNFILPLGGSFLFSKNFLPTPSLTGGLVMPIRRTNKKRERKILRSRFRPFFVRFSERNGIYFLAIVYNRVPLSSVVISSNSGSIAFTKASNHVWYASIMNLGSTPAVRQ